MAVLRISQVVTETWAQPTPDVRASQVVVETFSSELPSAALRASHVVVETFSANVAVAPGGLLRRLMLEGLFVGDR